MMKKAIRTLISLPGIAKNRILFFAHGVTYPSNSKVLGRIHIVNRGSIQIGSYCRINGKDKYDPIGCGDGCNLVTEGNGSIRIGEHFGMSNSSLFSRDSITIGSRVFIGGGVRYMTPISIR